MKKRIIITVVGVVTLPTVKQEPREKGFIVALSEELHRHFPEFEPDAKEPMVTVTVEDIPHKKKGN